jgi:chromosome segregation protein
LKDIQETLLALGLSQKSSWHISQGESDKILLAGKEERKSLVEDALGLRLYHTRIDEAFKKLEKTKLNIREANLKRKEVAPEIAELEKQITRIEKVFEYKQELKKNSKLYFYLKNKEISQIKQEISGFLSETEIKQKISDLEREIYLSQREIYETGSHDSEFWQSNK